jgi:hypothetical protein
MKNLSEHLLNPVKNVKHRSKRLWNMLKHLYIKIIPEKKLVKKTIKRC